MVVFSFPEEKGVRYLCAVFPFLVMSVAYVIDYAFRHQTRKYPRMVLGLIVLLMVSLMGMKSYRIAEINSDYREAALFLLEKSPEVKFLSTQKYVMDLYVSNADQVRDVPRDFKKFLSEVSSGYEYLVLDPQAYISFPAEGRFSTGLVSQYEYLKGHFVPLKVYDHFDPIMLERFVFEHSSNLLRSTEFLRLAKKNGFAKIYVYDLKLVVPAMLNTYLRLKGREGTVNDG
ncbi:MAG TPA: hypothetical protein VLJ10_03520, partial [Candidatus Bathyarchaeia archaeon]|nr:hypothetical protein [Candidatus Bathyarchaeia archaeon]